jgi:hypothetical protein
MKKLTSIVVNSVDFQNLKICRSLSYLCSPEYLKLEFRVQILHVCRSYHCQYLEFFHF